MFTAARLVAGIAMAIVAYVASEQVMIVWPEDIYFGNFAYINAGIGALVGWRVMGKQVRNYTSPSDIVSAGITTPIVMVALALFIYVGAEVLERSLARQYKGAVEALEAMIPLAFEYVTNIAYLHIGAILLIGGLIGAVLTRIADGRWR